MQVEKIYYQKNFSVSPFLFEHIGVGYTLNDGEDPKTALEAAKALCEEYHKENMAELDKYRGTHTVVIEEQPKISNEDKKKQQITGFVEAITTCTTLKALDIFTKLVERENIPELHQAYANTKKRLENE